VDPQATAFACRTAPYHFEAIGFWDEPDRTEANVAWVEDVFAATGAVAAGQVYVNSLDGDEPGRVAEAYGPNLPRLQAVKAAWDPQNVFRCNQNIVPVRA
jgi:FAD/FMN-containing dehydrogenase